MRILDEPEEQEVTPTIRRESLWAIIVILLMVIGVETTYILRQDKEPKPEESQQLNQNPLKGNPLGANTANSNAIVTQSPNNIPTLIPTTVPVQQPARPKKVNLNRTYNFPIKNSTDDEMGDFQLTVNSYELTSKVEVNNFYTATVSGDKKLLAVNLDIDNPTEQAFKLITRDYVRLSIDNGKWITPEIHSDPIELRPQSSKVTIVAFPIKTNDRNLRLQIGGIDDEKEVFDLQGI